VKTLLVKKENEKSGGSQELPGLPQKMGNAGKTKSAEISKRKEAQHDATGRVGEGEKKKNVTMLGKVRAKRGSENEKGDGGRFREGSRKNSRKKIKKRPKSSGKNQKRLPSGKKEG